MPSGPLPNPQRRRRNAPTIPTTALPAEGFAGPVPKSPYPLGKAGRAWWRWAWSTPSAAAWGPGDLYFVARRAQLEDDLVAMDLPALDLASFLDVEDTSAVRQLTDAVKRLKALAGGRASTLKLMCQLDQRMGLDPKALAELRWTITPPAPEVPSQTAPASDRWAKLRVADSA